MTRRWIEVNATRGAFATCAALSIGACVLVGCGSDERRAERMHRLAIEELEAGNTDAAAAHLEEILERYPSTEAADRARARLKELTRFTLRAGEEARSPLVALQFYRGDWIQGQNI